MLRAVVNLDLGANKLEGESTRSNTVGTGMTPVTALAAHDPRRK